MLELLSGRTHEVVSGLCLRTEAWEELHGETTRVTFRELAPHDIDRYLASGEWEGRAGAYAIQGLGAGARRADRGRLPERRRAARARCSSACSRSASPALYGFG